MWKKWGGEKINLGEKFKVMNNWRSVGWYLDFMDHLGINLLNNDNNNNINNNTINGEGHTCDKSGVRVD